MSKMTAMMLRASRTRGDEKRKSDRLRVSRAETPAAIHASAIPATAILITPSEFFQSESEPISATSKRREGTVRNAARLIPVETDPRDMGNITNWRGSSADCRKNSGTIRLASSTTALTMVISCGYDE